MTLDQGGLEVADFECKAFNMCHLHADLTLMLSRVLGQLSSFPLMELIFALMFEEVAADDADDWLCLECPPNIVTKHPLNLVKDSSSGEDCSALQAIAA